MSACSATRSPFLLFPVRIETRFRTIAAAPGNIAAAASHQLWVRIYPDDCSIDTFEPTAVASRSCQCQDVLD